MKRAFTETGDIELLKKVAEEMPEEESPGLLRHPSSVLPIPQEFEVHFQRTIDSGLWRPA